MAGVLLLLLRRRGPCLLHPEQGCTGAGKVWFRPCSTNLGALQVLQPTNKVHPYIMQPLPNDNVVVRTFR